MNYITSDGKGNVFSLSYMGEGIYKREYKNGRWSGAEVLSDNVRKVYSVTGEYGGIYVVCQQKKGDMLLYVYSGGMWKGRTILENKKSNCPDIYIKTLMCKEGMRLVYNIPEKGRQLIVSRMQWGEGWEKPVVLDSFVPLGEEYFKLLRTPEGIFVLYMKERGLYKKNIDGTLPEEQLFSGNIADYSVIWADGKLHFALIIKNRAGARLVYANRNRSRVIWEGEKASSCAIAYKDGFVCIYWCCGKRLYMAEEKKGFGNVTILGNEGYEKAAFQAPQSFKGNVFGEVPVNATRPYEICMGIDLLSCVNTDKNEEDEVKQLKAHIAAINLEMNKKESAINRLSGFMEKNRELQSENAVLRKRYKELLEKYRELEKK